MCGLLPEERLKVSNREGARPSARSRREDEPAGRRSGESSGAARRCGCRGGHGAGHRVASSGCRSRRCGGTGGGDGCGPVAGFGPVTVRPGDLRYDNLLRGNNFRFAGRPSEISVVGSTIRWCARVGGVRSGRRVAVRSERALLREFHRRSRGRVMLDLSPMDAVGYDATGGPSRWSPGPPSGKVYEALFKGWGVTIPAAIAGGRRRRALRRRRVRAAVPAVRLGGGSPVRRGGRGGRPHGTARAGVATREPDDPQP